MAGLIIAYGVNSFANVLMASTYHPASSLPLLRTHMRAHQLIGLHFASRMSWGQSFACGVGKEESLWLGIRDMVDRCSRLIVTADEYKNDPRNPNLKNKPASSGH